MGILTDANCPSISLLLFNMPVSVTPPTSPAAEHVDRVELEKKETMFFSAPKFAVVGASNKSETVGSKVSATYSSCPFLAYADDTSP